MSRRFIPVIGVIVLITLLGGCFAKSPEGGLSYTGPTEQTVQMGQAIPGSNIRYVGYSDQGAEVLINDQRALKKVGDSLDWKGSPVPEVEVSMSQRVVAANESRLQTVGTVNVVVRNVQPVSSQFPGGGSVSYKVGVTHTVQKGEAIPGTLITYTGKTDEGAQFGGVPGYPYRRMGDSVTWTGQLTANTYLDATYRIAAYTDDFVTLAALATIALAP